MRLNKKVLKKFCNRPLPLVDYLNLSGLNLDVLEHLGQCENLHWLIASDNDLQGEDGIARLKQLWYLDLSNNHIQNLNSLSKFLALGTLVLSNNNLKWSDLERLSHAHIMSLSLIGNSQLCSDPYYRIHVIDCLPLIWELDGRLVTVTERLHVKQFFIDTQYTEHPVRHKTCKTFQTTSLKNIGTEGVVSTECKYIFSKFPMSEKHTKHTDERRLKYLANMVQGDIFRMLQESNIEVPISSNFLNELMQERHKDVERCNMVLLLLVISLEFQLPTGLVRASLVSAQLDMIGSVSTMSFFLLPRDYRSRVVSVLLNAAKVDRDNNVKHEGGLYPQLFMCLYYTVAQLTRIRQTSRKNMQRVKPISHNSDYIALMASEAVSLMIQNIKFFSYFSSERGVVALVTAATGSVNVVLDVKDRLMEANSMMGRAIQDVYESITNTLLESIEIRLNKINIKMADIPVGDRYLSLSDSLPIKPLHSVIWASNYLSSGRQVPSTDPPILHPEREALKPKPLQAKRGEKVLLGPQVVGELTMLMEGNIAMARIDQVPVANGAVVSKLKSSDAHFTFVDMKSLCYAKDIGMWRPIRTAGDKYSIHSTDEKSFMKYDTDKPKSARKEDGYTEPLIYTPKEPPASQDKRRPTSSAEAARDSLCQVMVRRVMSADRTNSNNNTRVGANMNDFKQSLMSKEFNQLFPSASPRQTRPKTAIDTKGNKRVGSGLSCSSLHQNDNVHYIHGFTPRENSSRSGSVSILTTPATSDRQQIVMSERENTSSGKLDNLGDQSKQNDEEVKEGPISCSVSNTAKSKHVSTETVDSMAVPEHQTENVENEPRVDTVLDGKEMNNADQSLAECNSHDDVTEEQVDNNCPICIAVADGSLMTVANKAIEEVPVEQRNPVEIPQVEEEVVSSHVMVPVGDKKENIENVEPVSGVVNQTVSSENFTGISQALQFDRPKSAIEMYNYYAIQQPQGVFAMGTSAKMNERNTCNGFKTDFQQQREEAWRSTTRIHKQRPLTATIMTTSKLPSPQRPSSPSNSQNKNWRLNITKTERWLGGGRDLYWEAVRKRPKSGHTPGWKEGLPESMRRKRPMSAYVMSSTARPPYSARSVISTNASFRPYEYANYNGNFVRDPGVEDSLMFMPQTQPVTMNEPQSRQLTTPVSVEDHRVLQIQGIPPPSIPNPRKRHSSRYITLDSPLSLSYILEEEERGYEGRPSSHMSFNESNNNLTFSPRFLMTISNDDGLMVPVIPTQQTYHILQSHSDTKYRLCSFHKKLVFPYYAGPVIFD